MMFQERTWGEQWIKAAQRLAILSALTSLLPLGASWKWIAFAPILLVAVSSTPVLGGLWSGICFSGASLSLTTLPVSYREISRIVLLINRTRLLIYVPLVLVGCAFAGWKSGVGTGTSMIWGVKASYLAIVLQPLALMLRLNESANDRSRFPRALVNIMALIALVGILVASAFAVFQVDWQWNLWGAIGLFLVANIMLILDRRRHECGPLDLVSRPDVPQYWI
jgi:hypothetical protein